VEHHQEEVTLPPERRERPPEVLHSRRFGERLSRQRSAASATRLPSRLNGRKSEAEMLAMPLSGIGLGHGATERAKGGGDRRPRPLEWCKPPQVKPTHTMPCCRGKGEGLVGVLCLFAVPWRRRGDETAASLLRQAPSIQRLDVQS